MKIKRGQLDLNRANRIKLYLFMGLLVLAWRIGTMVEVVIEGEEWIRENKIYCSIWDGVE